MSVSVAFQKVYYWVCPYNGHVFAAHERITTRRNGATTRRVHYVVATTGVEELLTTYKPLSASAGQRAFPQNIATVDPADSDRAAVKALRTIIKAAGDGPISDMNPCKYMTPTPSRGRGRAFAIDDKDSF